MGRAERRAAERKNKQTVKPGTICLTKQELEDIKKQERIKAQNDTIMFFMTTLPLAEHRVHKFGKTRALRTLHYINDLMDGIINDTATIGDYRKMTEDEVGISITWN